MAKATVATVDMKLDVLTARLATLEALCAAQGETIMRLGAAKPAGAHRAEIDDAWIERIARTVAFARHNGAARLVYLTKLEASKGKAVATRVADRARKLLADRAAVNAVADVLEAAAPATQDEADEADEAYAVNEPF